MKTSKIIHRLIPVFFIAGFILPLSCTKSNISEPVYGDVFVFDSINVEIRYDDTPGFKYPLMEYVAQAVVHLTEKGYVSTLVFKSDLNDIYMGTSYDYITPPFEAGYKFRFDLKKWDNRMIDVNTVVPYELWFQGSVSEGMKEYLINSSKKVKYYNSGIQPELNSLQLTGPENRNYYPKFSPDGNWIYYQSSGPQRTIFRTDQNGNGYQKIADFTNSQLNQGEYGIIDNNHIAYVENGNQFSSIVIKDLTTMNDDVYFVNGRLSGDEPIKIPNTNKFLNLSWADTVYYTRQLLAADITTQKVDTLLKYFRGDIRDYTLNPRNKNIYLITQSNDYNILEYNFVTDQVSIFKGNVGYIENFRFFSNGYDYAFIKRDDNGFKNIFANISGVEKQITFYPSDVYNFNISPNDNYITFSANRRNEVQSWIIKLN